MSLRIAGCSLVMLAALGAASPAPTKAAEAIPPSPIDRVRPLVQKGDLSTAESLARQMHAEAIAAHGRESVQAAAAIDALVNVLFFQKRCDEREALPLAREAIAIKTRLAPDDGASLADSVNNEANLHWCAADFAAAGPLYRRALALREKALAPDDPLIGRSASNLATYLAFLGDYGAARPLIDRALAITEKAKGPGHRDVAQMLVNSSNCMVELGDLAEARSALDRAVAIQEKEIGPESGEVAGTLVALAALRGRMDDLEGARQAFERAFAIFRSSGDGQFRVATGMRQLAEMLAGAGEDTEARARYKEALAILETDASRYPHEIASCLNGLGVLDLRAGDLAPARAELERALDLREKTFGRSHPMVATTLAETARLEAYANHPAKAWDIALATEERNRRQFLDVASNVSEREAMKYEQVRVASLDIAASAAAALGRSLTPSQVTRTWDAIIRSRAMVLDELARRHHVSVAAGSPDLQPLVERFEAARSRLARLAVRGPGSGAPERYAGDLKQAQRERDASERAVLERSAALRSESTRREAGLREVAAALPKDGVLVAYFVYGRLGPHPQAPAVPSYLAFVIRQGRDTPSMVSLGPAEAIDAAIRRWKDLVQTDPRKAAGRDVDAEYRSAAAAVRAAVWDPLAPFLAGARLALVVPDGAIHQVSLATLVDQKGRYLLETGPRLQYLSAERDLFAESGSRPSGRGLLAMGGPDFDVRPSVAEPATSTPEQSRAAAYRGSTALCAARGSLRFDRLDAAAHEAEEIGALWEQATATGMSDASDALILTGGRAGEAAFKALAPGRRVMHVATHGFELDDLCPSILQAGDRPAHDARVSTLDNPLLLSGLALSGANVGGAGPGEGAGEDGMLTAEEIAALDLSGVEWVVLAACRSGSGSVVPGEGVMGLRRAFEVAGARTLIMSLWPVEDSTTRLWMHRLYESRLAGRSTVDSVREASLALLEEQRRAGWSPHPFYWGAFVAAGDWR
jgi:CHAT domain-containing protein/tetratricopeptide (TPR) repeat protein